MGVPSPQGSLGWVCHITRAVWAGCGRVTVACILPPVLHPPIGELEGIKGPDYHSGVLVARAQEAAFRTIELCAVLGFWVQGGQYLYQNRFLVSDTWRSAKVEDRFCACNKMSCQVKSWH